MRVIAATVFVATAAEVNPIRRVVTLLQETVAKIEADSERDEALFAKFECYCNTNSAKISAAITAGKAKVDQLSSDVPATEAQRSQVVAEIAQHKEERATANEAVETATVQRKKDNEAFEQEEADLKANTKAMAAAIAAIEKGSTGFLQTSVTSRVLQVVKSADIAEDDRESIQAFLQSKDTSGNSGEIVGILKEMFETMTKRVEEITRAEEEAVANFNQLVAAKNRELSAAQDSIEEKTQRQGEVAVQIATLKNDLDETSATLEKDEDYSASLEKNCKAKAQEYEGVKKTRAEELLALADTIKMLNSDDALELFKKALPSPESLLQMDATEKSARAEALAVVRNAARKFHHTKLDLLAMAISGKKEGFEYIVKLTKKMVASLKEEQAEDDNKLAYCEKEIVAKENAKKELSHELEGLDAHITADNNSVDTLKGDLKDLNANIKALDKSVAEATEQRKQEHSDYVSDVADDNASVQLIEMCINRMNKVYQPKQYKEDADSFVQLSASDAPEAFGSSSPNKGGKGVVLMLQKIRDDLKSSMNQEAMEEKDSQEDYERLMTDSTATRATYVAARTEKEAALADANADLTDTKSRRAETSGDMDEVKESIFALHASCDFLQNNYDARKSARNEEIESLEKSESVLGSDVSFMQTKSSFLRRN